MIGVHAGGCRPAGPAHLALIAFRQRLDLLPVGEILGQPQPGRVHHRREHHPAPQVVPPFEELVEGPEAPQHVLGGLYPVHADDEPAITDGRVQPGQLPGALR